MKAGDKVEILECHKNPVLVGKTAEVMEISEDAEVKYPVAVKLDEPIDIPTPVGNLLVLGPFAFREDELKLTEPDKGIPDAFTKED